MRNSKVRKRVIDSDDIYSEIYEAMKTKGVFDLKLCNFVKFCYGNVCRIKRFDLDLSHPSVVALYEGIKEHIESGNFDMWSDARSDYYKYMAELSNDECHFRVCEKDGYPIGFLIFYKAYGLEVKAKHDNDAPFISILRVLLKSLKK